MVLVHLAINGSLSLLMALLDDLFVHNGGCNLLVDGGVMVTSLLPKQDMSDQQSLPRRMKRALMSTRRIMADRLRVYCLHKCIKGRRIRRLVAVSHGSQC